MKKLRNAHKANVANSARISPRPQLSPVRIISARAGKQLRNAEQEQSKKKVYQRIASDRFDAEWVRGFKQALSSQNTSSPTRMNSNSDLAFLPSLKLIDQQNNQKPQNAFVALVES